MNEEAQTTMTEADDQAVQENLTKAARSIAEAKRIDRQISGLDDAITETKEQLKQLKADREIAVAKLRMAVRGDGPLFDSSESDSDAGGTQELEGEGEGAEGGTSCDLSLLGVEDIDDGDPGTPGEAVLEGWRDVRLDELSNPAIKPATLKILAEHEPAIVTIGDWVDWQETKGDFAIKDIKGLGKAAADSIADAMEGFWATWG